MQSEVVFWLKLVPVPGFKKSYIIEKQLHNSMKLEKQSFCCLPTQIREIWFHCLYIHSKLSQTAAVNFAAQSTVQQCNTVYSEPEGMARQQSFAPS